MAINDFGEKIGGAKKDLWKERGMILSDLSEMNEAERKSLIKKDNVWQKPDYAALVEDGLPIRVTWFIKTVRDSLGTKPVLTYLDTSSEAIQNKQEKYISFVGAVRDAVMNCKTEDDVLALGKRAWLADKGFIKAGNGYYVEPTAEAGDVITNKFLRAFFVTAYDLSRYDREIKKKQFLFSDEQKLLSSFQFFKYVNAEWGTDYRGATTFKLGGSYFYPKGEFADRNSWVEGTYILSNARHDILGRNFESLEAAKQFVLDRSSGKEAEKPKKKGKTRFVPAQLQHIKRDGDDVRQGRSMTGQDYLDAFEFKGGEFGNWMSEKDRQASLDMGYEALYDLAKVLKVETTDISLGDSLSIAFGARGSGNALAHYEPLREVINLTKMRGAGSLAHEWAHALDDILGKRLGLGGFMTEKLFDKRVPESMKTLVDAMKFKETSGDEVKAAREREVENYKNSIRRCINSLFPGSPYMTDVQKARKDALIEVYFENAPNVGDEFYSYVYAGEGIRDIDKLSELHKEITGRVIPKEERINLAHYQNSLKHKMERVDKPQKVKTDFYENSEMFDKAHSKTDHGYWASNIEMFARAFACYVHDKVEGRSDYLCGHSEMAVSEVFNKATGLSKEIAAIPLGEERKVINECFDAFIQELKDLGLLHHKEDFVVEVEREHRDIDWEALETPVGETYQMSFADLLDNAYERAGKSGSGEQVEFEFDK